MGFTKERLKKMLFGIAALCILSISIFGDSFGVKAKEDGWKNAAGDDAKAAAREARKGVVRIFNRMDGGYGKGSGFGVGKVGEETDIFITNRHVVVKEDDTVSDEIYILLDNEAVVSNGNGTMSMDKEHMVKCKVLYTTEDYPDFAILQAEQKIEGRVALPLLSSVEANEMDTVYAIGYPSNADFNTSEYIPAAVEDVTGTQGVISSFKIQESDKNTEIVQHDAHINHGNSGGPLITADGNVIAINTFIAGDGAEYAGSVIIDYAMDKLDELGIYYETGKKDKGSGFPIDMRILAAALAAALAVFAGMVIVLGKKKVKKDTKPITPADSGFRLQGVSGAFNGRRFAVNGRIRIGRDPKSQIAYPVNAQGISGRHCEIMLQNGAVYLLDVGSTYGTFVGGVRIQPNQPVLIKAGEPFYLGHPGESFVIINKNGR